MGGQACVLYGAAEFSRDTDIALFASPSNLELLTQALRSLQARRIAVPPFDLSYLQKGHAIHFRSYHPDSFRMRIDVLSVMRGVESFKALWERRVRMAIDANLTVDVISIADLVLTKKTQRDKDWPMIRRLIESHYLTTKNPSSDTIRFWLGESRTPRMLMELAEKYFEIAKKLSVVRPLLQTALRGNELEVEEELDKEQKLERERDRHYWRPLVQELEALRAQGYDTEEEV